MLKAVQEKPEAATIVSLHAPNGDEIWDQLCLQNRCWEFYSELYSTGPISNEERAAHQLVLQHVPASFTPQMGLQVSLPITMAELHLALSEMAKERCPGLDGLSVDFFLVMWDVLGEEYTRMINQAIQVSRLLVGMTKGMLVMIHKSGDRESLNNW
jgi:hypothetical protein